jgi:signal peptidase I
MKSFMTAAVVVVAIASGFGAWISVHAARAGQSGSSDIPRHRAWCPSASTAPACFRLSRLRTVLVYRVRSKHVTLMRKSVVTFKFPLNPKEDFVKRIIGLPGDLVHVKADKGVWVNHHKLSEPYIEQTASYDYGPKRIPAHDYFVLGDNRNDSYDSHAWGFLPRRDVIGEAVVDYTSQPAKFLDVGQAATSDPAARGMTTFRFDGTSMLPTLSNNSGILVYRVLSKTVTLTRKTVVEFKFPLNPKQDFMKRLIGLPGDLVQVRANNGVWVNHQKLSEPYVQQIPNYDYGPNRVPANDYFVLGDNRNNSYDSHAWGFLPKHDIIGKRSSTTPATLRESSIH